MNLAWVGLLSCASICWIGCATSDSEPTGITRDTPDVGAPGDATNLGESAMADGNDVDERVMSDSLVRDREGQEAGSDAHDDGPPFGYLPTVGPVMVGNYRGTYSTAFENEAFMPCGTSEPWMVYSGLDHAALLDMLPAECKVTATPSHERCDFYLDVEAHVVALAPLRSQTGPPYTKEMQIDHINVLALAPPNACTMRPLADAATDASGE
jgi:hypothetical protein